MDSSTDPDGSLTERVEALERALQRARVRLRAVGILAAAAVALAVMSVASRWLPSKQVVTNRVELVDRMGRIRATLAVEEGGGGSGGGGGPTLTLNAADESPRVRLGIDGQLGALSLLDADARERVRLAGNPSLRLTDTTRSRLGLEVTSDGPALELIDPRAFATLHAVDGLKLFGITGAPTALLAPGALSLYAASTGPDARLSVSISAPRQPGEKARLLLYDRDEAPSFAAP